MSRARVLIVRVGAMGDVLHALPAVAALRRAWPHATLEWVLDPRWEPLLSLEGEMPLVDRVHLAETRLWSHAPLSRPTRQSILHLRQALREYPYDVVVDLQGTLRSAAIARMARSPVRFGFHDPRERPARLLYSTALPRRGRHVVEQNAALLGDALQLSLAPADPVLPRSPQADEWAAALLAHGAGDRTVLLATTAGWGAKQWPVAHFAALARALASQGWRVLLNAAHESDAVPQAVARASAGAAHLVAPGVGELIALTRRLQLVVGGDTGPVHLAAALGTPVVALFGPTDPARNGPWGKGLTAVLRSPASRTSHRRTAVVEAGLASLSVDQVLAAVAALSQPPV